jgi:hypothetical protein
MDGQLAFVVLAEGKRMARPKGKPLPDSHRENITRAVRERARLMRAFAPIREAADSGDERLAIRLLREYIRSRKQEAA